MNTDKLTHPVVKTAIEAWQQGDAKTWLSLFTAKADLFDDGHPRDFRNFTSSAIGHEHFTSIDKVENNGREVYGQFHSDKWGDFKTYFRFYLDEQGKIYRLDIGQAE
jgi:hypothetical protein